MRCMSKAIALALTGTTADTSLETARQLIVWTCALALILAGHHYGF